MFLHYFWHVMEHVYMPTALGRSPQRWGQGHCRSPQERNNNFVLKDYLLKILRKKSRAKITLYPKEFI